MTKKTKLLFYFIVCSISFLFNSCERDDLQEIQTTEKLKLSEKRFEELIKEQPFNLAIGKVLNAKGKKNKTANGNAKTAVEDHRPVKIITTDSLTSYSMLITWESQQSDYFENLVLQVDHNNTTKAVILKYTPDALPIRWPLKGTNPIARICNPCPQSIS